jgi:hypothetical protein
VAAQRGPLWGAVVTVARGRLQGVAAVAVRGRSCGAASRRRGDQGAVQADPSYVCAIVNLPRGRNTVSRRRSPTNRQQRRRRQNAVDRGEGRFMGGGRRWSNGADGGKRAGWLCWQNAERQNHGVATLPSVFLGH